MNTDIPTLRTGRALAIMGQESQLAVTGGGHGHAIALSPWTGADNQLWLLEALTGDNSGYYRVTNKESGLVLDVSGASKKNGGKVIVWTSHGGANQVWSIQWMHDGGFRLRARHSGLVLDVSEYSATSGAIHQWKWHGGQNQRWSLGDTIAYGEPTALRSAHGRQLTAQSSGELINKYTHIRGWEKFTIVREDGSTSGLLAYGEKVALRTAHGKYLTAQPSGALNAAATQIRSWELFTLTRGDGSTVSGPVTTGEPVALRGAHGRYVMGQSNTSVNASATEVRGWERWQLDVDFAAKRLNIEYVEVLSANDTLVLRIEWMQCIRPATGINGDIADFFTGLAIEAATQGLSTFTVEGAIVGIGFGGAILGGVELAKWYDSDRSPDDLYLQRDGNKIWPNGQYESAEAESDFNLGIELLFKGSCTVKLMEYDSGSGDDLLGVVHVKAAGTELIDGVAVFSNYTGTKAEDALYYVISTVSRA